MAPSNLPPIHPGEILRDLYLEPLKMSAGALAGKLGVPRTRIERVVAEQSPVTTDTALRLARFFSTTPEYWLNMQAGYDLRIEMPARQEELDKIEPLRMNAA